MSIPAILHAGETVYTASDIARIANIPGRCIDCRAPDIATYEPCPYAEEIEGDSTPVWLCEPCRHERAQDI